ncbi:hypothetical protein ACIQCM_04410 [Pseudarthrobacter sp. NPDC092439]|uniref:hypothetical protein n=1 Tax=unclassified Pseudarthrobacter TaxID=2647000 RepID=UPI00382A9244
MRTVVSAAAAILGMLLAAAAVPAIWLDRAIVREDGFVALAGPLGNDPAFQERLAAASVGTIDTSAVPGFLADLVQPVLEDAAASLTGLPEYRQAWEDTLRKSHRLSLAAEGEAEAEGASASSLTLDVSPLVALGAGEISRATGLPLDPPARTLLNAGGPEQKEWAERLAAYAPAGYLLAAGSAVALLLAVVAARRRWTLLAGVGLGALLAAGCWTAAGRIGRDRALGTDAGSEVANMFRDEFVAAASRDFQPWTLAAAVAGAVALAAGLLGRSAARKRERATGSMEK